eukprot:m.160917 g.160917  ORF g.160917 m.160917 type:complete len:347 (-) comp17631_c4_seq2:62-1102(-)
MGQATSRGQRCARRKGGPRQGEASQRTAASWKTSVGKQSQDVTRCGRDDARCSNSSSSTNPFLNETSTSTISSRADSLIKRKGSRRDNGSSGDGTQSDITHATSASDDSVPTERPPRRKLRQTPSQKSNASNNGSRGSGSSNGSEALYSVVRRRCSVASTSTTSSSSKLYVEMPWYMPGPHPLVSSLAITHSFGVRWAGHDPLHHQKQHEDLVLHIAFPTLALCNQRRAVVARWSVAELRSYSQDGQVFLFKTGRSSYGGARVLAFRIVDNGDVFDALDHQINHHALILRHRAASSCCNQAGVPFPSLENHTYSRLQHELKPQQRQPDIAPGSASLRQGYDTLLSR